MAAIFHWYTFLRKMTSSKRDQLLARAFHAIMGKTEADILQIARNWNCMNLHTSKILFQKDSSYKCQFCIKVRALSRLVSKVWSKI